LITPAAVASSPLGTTTWLVRDGNGWSATTLLIRNGMAGAQ
jgi:hypothetical protein